MTPLQLPCNDQVYFFSALLQRGQGADQILESLVRGDLTQKQQHPVARRQSQTMSRVVSSERGRRYRVVDAKRYDGRPLIGQAEVGDELPLHRIRMNEHMIAEPILET